MRGDTKRTGRAPGRRQAGFSLIEVMIAAILLFLIIGISARLLNTGQILLGTTSVASEAKQRADKVAAQIADRIRNGVLETLTDSSGTAIADGATVYDGFKIAIATGFEGEPVLGDYLQFVALGDGEANITNQVDDDKDNLRDERALFLRYTPDAAGGTKLSKWSVPVATPTDGGRLASGMGIFDPSEAFAASDKDQQPTKLLGGMSATLEGRRLTIRVGILRADPTTQNSDRTPRVKSYVGTAYVVLFN